jgi:hypothetical protein
MLPTSFRFRVNSYIKTVVSKTRKNSRLKTKYLKSTLYHFQRVRGDGRRGWRPHDRRFMDADGIIHTAAELDQGVLSTIAEGRCTRGTGCAAPTLYPIGSVISFPRLSTPATRVRVVAGGWSLSVHGLPLLQERRVRVKYDVATAVIVN